jgi:hypothetical protein
MPSSADEPPSIEALEAEEQRLAELFRDDMATIVAGLNAGSFEALNRAIDDEDMLERIFGLRLIDGRIKRDFRQRMLDDDGFDDFIEAAYSDEAADGIRATLLLVESRGRRGRAVVRFDLPYFQVNYIEYELEIRDDDRVTVVDWRDFMKGYRFTDRMGLMLVQAQPNNNAARKLVDFPTVTEAQVFQVVEALKAARDRNFERFFSIYDGFDEQLKAQRPILVAGLDAARTARKRREQRKLLVAIDRYLPEDPLFALPLLDYYFPARQYDRAWDALMRVKDTLRIDDAATSARLSSAALVRGQVDEANAYANDAVAKEPELELGWWSAFRARVAAGDYAAAVAALDVLHAEFGHDLNAESLGKDRALAPFVASPEFRDWLASGTDG